MARVRVEPWTSMVSKKSSWIPIPAAITLSTRRWMSSTEAWNPSSSSVTPGRSSSGSAGGP